MQCQSFYSQMSWRYYSQAVWRYSKLLFAKIYIQMNNDFVAIRNDANIKGSMQKNPAQPLYLKSDFNLLQ